MMKTIISKDSTNEGDLREDQAPATFHPPNIKSSKIFKPHPVSKGYDYRMTKAAIRYAFEMKKVKILLYLRFFFLFFSFTAEKKLNQDFICPKFH